MTGEREIVMARWELASRDPLCFARWFCFTVNSHAPDDVDPVQAFPADRPHTQCLTRLWQNNRVCMVPKSRQMLVTWWASMLSAWVPLFHDGRLVFQQSKRLQDVVGNKETGDGLLGRTQFILEHIPYTDWVLRPGDIDILTESVTFPRRNSSITPIAQGGDKIRSHTVSFLVSDETAFQPDFESAWLASIASIRRGRCLLITTPDMRDGGCSFRIARDLPDPR